jgi:hypothetical protein
MLLSDRLLVVAIPEGASWISSYVWIGIKSWDDITNEMMK